MMSTCCSYTAPVTDRASSMPAERLPEAMLCCGKKLGSRLWSMSSALLAVGGPASSSCSQTDAHHQATIRLGSYTSHLQSRRSTPQVSATQASSGVLSAFGQRGIQHRPSLPDAATPSIKAICLSACLSFSIYSAANFYQQFRLVPCPLMACAQLHLNQHIFMKPVARSDDTGRTTYNTSTLCLDLRVWWHG
jgi:hypothetical protein